MPRYRLNPAAPEGKDVFPLGVHFEPGDENDVPMVITDPDFQEVTVKVAAKPPDSAPTDSKGGNS